jgi:RluA family pseudouridine synthase
MTPEEIQSLVLYRDGLILVLNKPAGIAVHAGSKKADDLEKYFCHLQYGLPRPPALAHRLDKDTSGCLVLGRHPKALRKLGTLFEKGLIEKTYWAIVEGCPPGSEGIIDLPLAPQSDKKYHWWMKVDRDGKPAVTHYRVLREVNGKTWLELKPKTGRTHQLRVHCAAMGFPIKGDSIYNPNSQPGVLLHLHAQAICIPLSANKSPLLIEAPVPFHMQEWTA